MQRIITHVPGIGDALHQREMPDLEFDRFESRQRTGDLSGFSRRQLSCQRKMRGERPGFRFDSE